MSPVSESVLQLTILNASSCYNVPSFHYCRLFTSDGKTRVGSLYNKDSKKYNRMSLQGNIVSIEQLQNFRASKMNFWNNVVPNTNFTCNAYSSAAPRRVFHMSSFFLTPCELVLFFYVNKYLQASNNEQLLYTHGVILLLLGSEGLSSK